METEDVVKANCDLQALDEKYRSLDLSLNAKKTKAMRMVLQQPTNDIELTINGTVIEQVSNFKYLGVELDPKLSYSNQVRRVSTKCKQAMGALSRATRKWIPRPVFEQLYKMTIEPMATYAIEAWYPSQVGLQSTIERLNKFSAKAMRQRLHDWLFYATINSLLETLPSTSD